MNKCSCFSDIKTDFVKVGVFLELPAEALDALGEIDKVPVPFVLWRKILLHWKREKADNATLAKFVEALENSKYEEIRKAIDKSYQSGAFLKPAESPTGTTKLDKQRSKFVEDHVSTLCKLTYWTPTFFQQLREKDILSGSEVQSLV